MFLTALKKKSQICPKVKKLDLMSDLVIKYRPIPNVPFLCKIIEKSAASQINNYLNSNNLTVFPDVLSAYRKHYSIETALLRFTGNSVMSP